MILLEDVLLVHESSIKDFGGSHGIRDMGSLEAAIARSFQTFGGEDLYPTPFAKAAAVEESIIMNHPFIDGNKRTGVIVMIALLREYDIYVNAESDSLYELTISISTGQIKFDQIIEWLKINTEAV
jgi:death-on-curing protein